jgi:hypothetical protein
MCLAPAAHTCNPCDSGGRDKKDHGLKSAWANSLQDPILKTPITKKGLVDWLEVQSLSSSPSSAPHTKKTKTEMAFCFQKWRTEMENKSCTGRWYLWEG